MPLIKPLNLLLLNRVEQTANLEIGVPGTFGGKTQNLRPKNGADLATLSSHLGKALPSLTLFQFCRDRGNIQGFVFDLNGLHRLALPVNAGRGESDHLNPIAFHLFLKPFFADAIP